MSQWRGSARSKIEYSEFTLGLIQPREAVATTLDAVANALRRSERTTEQVITVFRQNRVVRIADRALTEADELPEPMRRLGGELKQLVVERQAREAAVDRSCALLEELGVAHGIAVWGIKGLAIRRSYPRSGLRDLRDADVAVGDHEEAFLLARLLRDRGFSTQAVELPWVKADLRNQLYGQYKLAGPDGLADIDIHFGPGYSAGHCGLLPLPAPEEPGLRPLSVAANLRPMLGNSGGDVHITAKDVNDMWVAASVLRDEEVESVIADAHAAALDGQLAAIARIAVERLEVAPRQLEVLSRLAEPSGKRSERVILASGPMERTSRVRVLRTAARAYRQARSHNASSATAAGAVVGALAYYSIPLRPRLTPLPAIRSTPRPWRCVRLVPMSLAVELGDGSARTVEHWTGDMMDGAGLPKNANWFEWKRVGSTGRVLVSGDTTFLPTVWFTLSRPLIRRASAMPIGASGGGPR